MPCELVQMEGVCVAAGEGEAWAEGTSVLCP